MICTYQCEFHVASLAPPIAPGVADDPVPTCDVDTNDVDAMVDGVICSTAGVDAALVERPVICINGNGKRPSSQHVVDHILLPRYLKMIHHRDCVIIFAVVACACRYVVRVQVFECDPTHVADLLVRGFRPASLTASVRTPIRAVDDRFKWRESSPVMIRRQTVGETHHLVTCCTDRIVCGLVRPALMASDSIWAVAEKALRVVREVGD